MEEKTTESTKRLLSLREELENLLRQEADLESGEEFIRYQQAAGMFPHYGEAGNSLPFNPYGDIPTRKSEIRVKKNRVTEKIRALEKEQDRLEKNTNLENGGNLGRAKGFTHGEDFRCVNKDGLVYNLTTNEAYVIQILKEAHDAGTPNVSQREILDRVSPHTSTRRVSDIFKKHREVYRALIEQGERKGMVRLKL